MTLPLDGMRVLDYGQYVAGPFATMLLSDLGADVVKVEPPRGDEWRRYDPFEEGESRYFYALNRGKRSVALDLRTEAGRAASRELIAGADALVHNCLPERARRFGLDRDSVQAVNPRCVCVCVSSFGSSGPDAERPAYDLIGQALSGLLLADPRPGEVPRRAGGLALADFTAGLLAAVAVAAGLAGRGERAAEVEVSLLGAALALQAQRFVAVEGRDDPGHGGRSRRGRAWRRSTPTTARTRARTASSRSPASTPTSGARVCELLGLSDPLAENPQAEPADAAERAGRAGARARRRGRLRAAGRREAVAAWRRAGCRRARCERWPALRRRAGAGERPRADGRAAGRGSRCGCSGSPFKVDGGPAGRGRPAPGLGEHAASCSERATR